VAKRLKRSSYLNPRQDRNLPEYLKNSRNAQLNTKRNYNNTNVIEFPVVAKKKHVEIIPRSLNQEHLLAALEDPTKHIVFSCGCAGSGKTYLSTLYAVKQLRAGHVSKIIITRPNVAVDDNPIGYLPGDLLAKMTPWIQPLIDILLDYYSRKEIEHMMREEVIEIMPLAFSRGRTFRNAIVLLDESQGTTQNSLLSILTRIGENCKILVTGDIDQSDRGKQNGLADFIERFSAKGCDGIEVIRFTAKDVQRHPIIPRILALYNKN
jgi:phosphate starvation-inducible PhoH-like protein